jgi:RNA polymerase sigma-70 factor (ECF subfamily)
MTFTDQQVMTLLARAGAGSESALEELLNGFRPRLRCLVAVRLDSRLCGRVDPSDVVQEVFAEAWKRMPRYVNEQPLPFYLWLRRLALDQMSKLHRRHIVAQRRSVVREANVRLSDESVALLTERLAVSPSGGVVSRDELCARVQAAMNELSENDRELLVMRYIEGLTLAEIASVLEISVATAKTRHLRALARMGKKLAGPGGER